MAETNGVPTVVIFVTERGVAEVQIVSPSRREESAGQELYERVKVLVDRIDRVARQGRG